MSFPSDLVWIIVILPALAAGWLAAARVAVPHQRDAAVALFVSSLAAFCSIFVAIAAGETWVRVTAVIAAFVAAIAAGCVLPGAVPAAKSKGEDE